MRIEFDGKGYIECNKTDTGKIALTISAKDQTNSRKKITNTVELTIEEFKKLISEV